MFLAHLFDCFALLPTNSLEKTSGTITDYLFDFPHMLAAVAPSAVLPCVAGCGSEGGAVAGENNVDLLSDPLWLCKGKHP